MIRLLALIALALAFAVGSPLSADEDSRIRRTGAASGRLEKYGQEIDDLSSDSFELRRKAFVELWRGGEAASQALDAAAESANRQVQEVAIVLTTLLSLGIEPSEDIPPSVAALVNGIDAYKILGLCRAGHWQLASALLKKNPSPPTEYGDYVVNSIVSEAIEQENLENGWLVLREVMAIRDASWVAAKLELELPEDTAPEDKALREMYAGNFVHALDLAQDPEVQLQVLTRGFLWDQFAKEEFRSLLTVDATSPTSMAVHAALLGFAGQFEQADSLWSEVFEIANMQLAGKAIAREDFEDDEQFEIEVGYRELLRLSADDRGDLVRRNQLMMALMMSGRRASVEKFLVAESPYASVPMLISAGKLSEVMNILGLAEDRSDLATWLESMRPSIIEDFAGGDRIAGRLKVRAMSQLASALVDANHTGEAKQILDTLVAVAAADPEFEMIIWTYEVAVAMRGVEQRELYREVAKDHRADISESCRNRLLQILYPDLDSCAKSLFLTCDEFLPEADPWEVLDRLAAWDRDYFGDEAGEFVGRWLRRARNWIEQEDLDDNLSADHMKIFAELATEFGQEQLAIEFLSEDLSEYDSDSEYNVHWAILADYYLKQGNPEAASLYLASLRQMNMFMHSVYVREIQSFLHAGKYDQARLIDRSRWMRPERFGGENYAQAADDLLGVESLKDYRDEYYLAAFMLAEPSSFALMSRASDLADAAEEAKDYEAAADYRRAALVESLKPFSTLVQTYYNNYWMASMNLHCQAERMDRAIHCVETEQLEAARRHLAVAAKLQPLNIEVVVQCYPRLKKVGKTEWAEQLFVEYESTMLEQLRLWPENATLKNNLAWMYSQCDVKLEQALALAEEAIALSPKSATYLDTLAEVHYRQGNVEKALELMRQCVRLDPRESHYRSNLDRFKSGE